MPPFYIQLILALLVGSLLLCTAVYLCGTRRALPAVPMYATGAFPNAWDTIGTAFFIILFVGSLASTLPMTEATAELKGTGQTQSVTTLALELLIQALVYVPMAIRFCLLPKRERQPLGFPRAALMVMAAVGLILCFSTVLGALRADKLIMDLTGCPEQQDVVQSMMDGNAAQKVILAIAAVIMAPIGEEICFRGFIYNILRQRAGVWAAAIATGVLFGAVHASLVQFLPLVFFGMVQCFIYEKSKTLLVPMAVHAVFNSFSVAVILAMPYLPEAVRNTL